MTIDNGCTGNIIRLNVVERLKIPIKPTKVKAKLADDKTYLDVVGEISIELVRGKQSFKFDAIVVKNLGPDALAGTPFQKNNDVMTDFVNELIIVKKKVRYPFTSEHIVEGAADTFLVRVQRSEIILPGEYLDVKIPRDNPPSQSFIIENRQCSYLQTPMEIDTVGYNMRIPNLSTDPIEVKKNSHIQVRRLQNIEPEELGAKHEYPKKPVMNTECDLKDVSIDPSGKLFSDTQKKDIEHVLKKVSKVFSNDDSTYKGQYKASFEFSSETRPILKNSKLPSYSSKHNNLLQQKCDKLWSRGKIVPISDLGIQPNCLNQPFLVRKQKAMHKKLEDCTEKDTRMVTSFGPLAKLVKKNVSKVTTEKEVWAKLAEWKYIAESDLTDSFHQLVLRRSDTSSSLSNTNIDCSSYMCFKTPYKGIFAYVTGAQGMPGMSEHLDNVLDATIGDLIQMNKAFKIHDQIYIGGQDFDSFLSNVEEVFDRLAEAGLRLGTDKTIIGVYSSVIYGKLWHNGTLAPSQHKITNLAKVPIPETVGKLRSFIQGAKINSECLKGLAASLAPFGKLVGSDKSKHEKVQWNPSLEESFYKAQDILRSPESITIPKSSDQLLIVVDTATKPESIQSTPENPMKGESASSATLMVKRKDEKNLRIGGYFGFKVKSGMLPCEAEGKGLERAVEHWDHYIRENENPTICLIDNNSVVQCAKKLCKGEYSESSRLQSFLYLLNSKNLNIQHNSAKISNKFIENVDWGSRNDVECKPDPNLPGIHENCPYCQFAWKNDDISFASVRLSALETKSIEVNVMEMSVQDIMRKSSSIPFKTRSSWLNLQKSCADLRKAVAHIKAGTVPGPKEKDLRIARYYIQHCKVATDGLLIHEKQVPLESKPRLLIVVPQSFLRALVLQLHTYCDTHTTELQTEALFGRMFWAIHLKDVVKDVVTNCRLCLSTKPFPKTLLQFHTETKPTSIGSQFAADVLVKGGKFLILREVLTSHTATIKVKDEKEESLRDGLMALLAHYKTMKEIQIRIDNQSGMVALVNNKVLKKLNITVIPGDSKNINKNPVAERAVREIEDEMLKIQSPDREITASILAQATMAVNNKIRYTGYTANELFTNTNSLTGDKLKIDDQKLSDLQFENRQKVHLSSAKSKATPRGSKLVNPTVRKGDLIMIKSDKSKHEARKTYIVIDIDDENRAVIVQKFVNNQLRAKKYKVKIEQVILVEEGKSEIFNKLPETLGHDENKSNASIEERSDNQHDEVEEEFDLDNFGDNPARETRQKPRLDYSRLNETGDKVLKVQRMKIDLNSKCMFCYSKKYSNFYHSESICLRKQEDKEEEKDKENDEDDDFFCYIPVSVDDVYHEVENIAEIIQDNNEQEVETIANNDDEDFIVESIATNSDVVLIDKRNSNSDQGIANLRDQLEIRQINYDICAPEVLAMVKDYIDFHTIGARIEIAVVKLQTWWRRILERRFQDSWDKSEDPPNWGTETDHPVSLEIYSDEEFSDFESLFSDIEIEKAKLRSENLQVIIDELDVSGGAKSKYINLSDPAIETLINDVFEHDEEVDPHEVTVLGLPEKTPRTSSVSVNVFDTGNSRANSEESFVTVNAQRQTSMNEDDLRRMTRSRSNLVRVPIDTTPLKQNVRESFTPPDTPPE